MVIKFLRTPKTFEKSFASHPRSKFWSKNNKYDDGTIIDPKDVFLKCNFYFLFNCVVCNHEFNAIPNSIVSSDAWCNFCSHNVLCNEKCDFCYENSFASHPKAKFWSSKNMDDDGEFISPRDVFKSKNTHFLFDCDKCKHEISIKLSNVTSGFWCSYCSYPCQNLCPDEKCNFCYKNSFASHPKAKFWSIKNGFSPRSILKGTHKKCLFDCEVCKHEFSSAISDVVSGKWCGFCKGSKLCNDELCDFCFEKSFVSHEKAKFWSDKNLISPRFVSKGSHKKFLFDCEEGHIFESDPAHISDGRWCPVCKNKTEKKLYEYLKNIYVNITHNFKPEWCINDKTNRYLPFDILLKDFKIIIELDGIQHFIKIEKWNTNLEKDRERDIKKMQLANENGYCIIRILQDDVWNNKNNWKERLENSIEYLQTKKSIKNIFIDNKGEYDEFPAIWIN